MKNNFAHYTLLTLTLLAITLGIVANAPSALAATLYLFGL